MLVGMKIECTESDTSNIVEVWHQFGPMIVSVPGKVGSLAFGVIWDSHNQDGRFRYMAAVEHEANAPIPDGMQVLEIPAMDYAVFEHDGSLDNLKGTIHAIFSDWVPTAGEKLAVFPSMLEVYGDEFDPQTSSGRIELWVALA